MTNQPEWKCISSCDDFAIFVDTTGVYAPEVETIASFDDSDDDSDVRLYRFSCERLKITEKTKLIPIGWDSTWPYAASVYEEWFSKELSKVASSIDESPSNLRKQFCSDDAAIRAHAYLAVAGYHGLENLDSYPSVMTRAAFDEHQSARWVTAE